MLAALTFALVLSPLTHPRVGGAEWTCREEVYELAQQDGILYAKTSGGIVALKHGRPTLVATMPPTQEEKQVSAKGDGAFLSATAKYGDGHIASYWGGKNIHYIEGSKTQPLIARPPATGDYSLLTMNGIIYAGTDRGLFARIENDWKKIDLGGELPFARIHGFAKLSDNYVIGGTQGAAFGKPGHWRTISKQSVRQIARRGSECWILYGSGAIDRVGAKGKVSFDILHGAAKRPWASCIGQSGKGILLGGSGGWLAKGTLLTETYPEELKSQTITAIASHKSALVIGTQAKGVAIFRNGTTQFYNPSNGLADNWVTSILIRQNRIFAATATAGLYEITANRAVRIETLSNSLRHLAVLNGRLVVGALDGAWVQTQTGWRKFETASRETTCLSFVGNRLWIGTPSGLTRAE